MKGIASASADSQRRRVLVESDKMHIAIVVKVHLRFQPGTDWECVTMLRTKPIHVQSSINADETSPPAVVDLKDNFENNRNIKDINIVDNNLLTFSIESRVSIDEMYHMIV